MDGPRYYHVRWSKKERQAPYDTTHVWNLKYDTDELIFKRNRRTDVRNRRMVAMGGRGGAWGRVGLGVWD